MQNFIRKYLGVVLIGVGIVVFYVLMTDVFHVLNDFLFPSLTELPPLVPEYIGQLMEGLGSSLYLLIISYGLAVLTGVALGTLIGLKAPLRKNLNPWINALSAIPVPLLTPYAINIFPTFRSASIFLIWLAAFWVILGTTIGAVVAIDRRYLENAATLELPASTKLFKVILPAAAPAIMVGCSIALTLSFMMLAVAEMFGATSGMAFFIQYYSDFARFDLVLVGFIFIAIVLVIIKTIYDAVQARVTHWTLNN